MSVLSDLAKAIRSGGPVQDVQDAWNGRASDPPRRPQRVGIVKSGAGGVLFNFGGYTGHPYVDRYNMLLRQTADPNQLNISQWQSEQFNKALDRFIDVGKYEYERQTQEAGVDLNTPMDKQVEKAYKNGEFGEVAKSGIVFDSLPKPTRQAQGEDIGSLRQEFEKSSIHLAGEEVVATSETDAALIEMMKSNPTLE